MSGLCILLLFIYFGNYLKGLISHLNISNYLKGLISHLNISNYQKGLISHLNISNYLKGLISHLSISLPLLTFTPLGWHCWCHYNGPNADSSRFFFHLFAFPGMGWLFLRPTKALKIQPKVTVIKFKTSLINEFLILYVVVCIEPSA